MECPLFKCSIEDLERDAKNTPSLPFQIMNQLKSLQIICVKAMVGFESLSALNPNQDVSAFFVLYQRENVKLKKRE